MHLKRWITGLTLLPVILLLILKGGEPLFALFISLVCILGMVEFFSITAKIGTSTNRWDSINRIAFVTGPAIVWAAYMRSFELIILFFAANMVLTGIFATIRYSSEPGVVEVLFKQSLGTIYLPVLFALLVAVRSGQNGEIWIILILGSIFAGDTGAFYAGRKLGKHKLLPGVSPGKTVEGAFGGLIGTVFIGFLFKLFFLTDLPWIFLLFMIGAGITGQAGDLFVSVLKRTAGVKDTGRILPGHGGLLDRIDALLFSIPVFFLMKYVL